MKRKELIALCLPLLIAGCARQDDTTGEINDSTTPLHLLTPDYRTPYGQLTPEQVKADIDRVFAYIDSVTPARVVDADGTDLTDPAATLPDGAKLNQGTYRLTSYEWGVTYMALLKAAEILNDSKYKDYVTDRIGFLAKWAPAFAAQAARTGKHDGQMRQVVAPASLDDAGAMSGAFMLAALADPTLDISVLIENYYDVVENRTYRLPDGTIARNRPHHNAVWLDDMFMALPAMAVRSQYASDPAQLDNAAKMATQFIDRMWMPDKKIFRHGYVEGMEGQPSMAWGRANGWAILTMTRLLDYLPENHPQRGRLMATLRDHIGGLASLQGKDGFWHQLLDRPDSYDETSATAIFTYCIAHAINEGWIDATLYGPVAHLGWEAVASKINPRGEVEDVCVGTGMGFDPAFYYYRPVSVKAAHGYGPAILAGAEMARLLGNYHPRMNDSGIHYYKVDPETDVPIFSLDANGKALETLH